MEFIHFKTAVATQFKKMQAYPMFRVETLGRNELWETYLKAFPPGTNPVFRERTEYDCACCRHFIRDVGNVVALVGDSFITVWDTLIPSEPNYEKVANKLNELVRSKSIKEPFLHYQRSAGTDKNFEQATSGAITWNHFFVNIDPKFVKPKKDIPTLLGAQRTSYDVLKRALEEITLDSIDTVIDMISQGSLYRGDEHKHAVLDFQRLKKKYTKGDSVFIWRSIEEKPAVVNIRNSVIGTLLIDLSEGKDIEAAVGAYEAKVAPTNYKRPTALVTKAMIEKAKTTIVELGLTSALERRFAILSDIKINNVLFADRSAKKAMTSDVFDDIATKTKPTRETKVIEEIPIGVFINNVLPTIDTLEVMLENKHVGNFVSLIAPIDPTAGQLFKWGNAFSWSYAGEMADSIKERVKKAGGNVTGDLCCRLAWHNHDDLDFHMKGPRNEHISFLTKGRPTINGGILDVDMNAGHGTTRTPVENIFYPSEKMMPEGRYTLFVNQYNNRDMTDPGFEVEIDWKGTVWNMSSQRSPRQSENIIVAEMDYSKKNGISFVKPLEQQRISKQAWGLNTESFHRASVMMLSPNHWDGEMVGNKHYFFMLDDCVNDGTARGFFNEFLKGSLDPHRKVLEIVGSKMKVASAPEQLSGLGFSSTQKNTLLCRVKGSYTRTIKIIF